MADNTGGWFGRILCYFGKHERLRESVHRKGLYYVGRCANCGVPLRKRYGAEWTTYTPDKTDR